tara:strand:- start:184 stop:510 length:327 start_codon:yes stop_codon:yes gene_type:complete
VAILGTTRELVQKEIQWVQRVGNCERNLRERMGGACAVLVEHWATIPELVRLCIQKKSSKSGGKDCAFVPIVKRRDTTSRPVQFSIQIELSSASEGKAMLGFVQLVEK